MKFTELGVFCASETRVGDRIVAIDGVDRFDV